MINFLIPNIMADSKFHNPFVVSKTQIKVCSSISLIDVVIQNLGKILRASCDPICAGYKLPIFSFSRYAQASIQKRGLGFKRRSERDWVRIQDCTKILPAISWYLFVSIFPTDRKFVLMAPN